MNTLDALSFRKSVRTYLPNEVEEEKLNAVLGAGNESARCAGPAIRLYVVRSRDIQNQMNSAAKEFMSNAGGFLAKLAANPNYIPLQNAPVVILITAETGDSPVDGNSYQNAACAAENMLIAATDVGLASCYVAAPAMAFSTDTMKNASVLPSGENVVCGVLVGYSEDYAHHADRPEATNIQYID